MEDDSSALPNCWTAIAERPRVSIGNQSLEWRELPDAPLTVADARLLCASDFIVMANRHFGDRVELVVRPAFTPIDESESNKRRERRQDAYCLALRPGLGNQPSGDLIPVSLVEPKRRKTSAPL